MNNERKLFESIDDVYKELEMCYDEIIEKNISNVGETLYLEHFYFSNTSDLVDEEYQQLIKEYHYSKTFNTPPYSTIKDTPAQLIDDFLTIEREVKSIRQKDNK